MKYDGIGKKMVEKINEMIKTGELKLLTELGISLSGNKTTRKLSSNKLNEELNNDLSDIFGIGTVFIKQLEKQGIYTIKELEKAVKNNQVKLNEQQRIGLRYVSDLKKKISRVETQKIGTKLEKLLALYNKQNDFDLKMTIAGSYPSGKRESKDVDIILSTDIFKTKEELQSSKLNILNSFIGFCKEKSFIIEVLSSGITKFMGLVRLTSRSVVRHLDIILVPKNSFIFAFLHFTGGREFNQLIREKAKRKGYTLSEWGLMDVKTGIYLTMKTELDIFKKIDLEFITLKGRH
jgi:DNA polymerase (family 10)